jgi:hypothetical protein
MTTPHRLVVAFTLAASTAFPAAAQDLPMAIRIAAACGPQATTAAVPSDAPRIAGLQDTSTRSLYGPHDLVVVDVGSSRGIQLGQRFFVRRSVTSHDDPAGSAPRAGGPSGWKGFVRRNMTSRGGAAAGPHLVVTSGWMHIVAVNDSVAIGSIDVACDGVLQGDYLEPYVEPATPADAARTDTSGTLDFSTPAHVLFGDYGRLNGGVGDMMVADIGQGQGATPGARFAVYRDMQQGGLPLAAVGEAVIVSVGSDTSLLRLTRVTDAVVSGDLLIPRKKQD